ncbi:MAK10-like protein [Tanacetum coccineum]
MGDENPIRTLGDYSKPSHEGYRNTIELPAGNNVVPLRSDTVRLVQNGCSFHELRSEDPNQHLKDFLKLVDSLDLDGENRERTHPRLFQFSLLNQASNWLERLPAGSISTWEDLTTRFLAQFFPPGRIVKLRNHILMVPSPQPQALDTTFEARVQDYMTAHTERMERFENTIFKQREEINGRMTEMFRLFKELTTSRTPKKVLIREKVKFPVTKNMNSISLTKGEEGGSNKTKVTPDNAEKLTEIETKTPIMEVPRCMAWLDYGKHVDSLSTMDNEVGVISPESTTHPLPSFEEYIPPVTYPEEVEKTLGTLIEEMFYDDWRLEYKEVSPLGEELSLFDRPNKVERGRILEVHRLESILQQQISQRMAPSHHDGRKAHLLEDKQIPSVEIFDELEMASQIQRDTVTTKTMTALHIPRWRHSARPNPLSRIFSYMTVPKWNAQELPNFATKFEGGGKRHKPSGSSSFNTESGDASINLNTNVGDNNEDRVQEIR